MRWLIGALIGVICAVTFMYGYVVRQPVKIQYSVNKLTMFFVNFVTFMFAVMCILVFFEMSIKYNEKIQTDSIIKAYAIQTIRQGGGALIVTILVGVMNRVMIQCYELEYFSSYNPIIYKIKYTIICLFCSIIFLVFAHTINVSPIDNPVLGQAMAWLLTTIQIWISFDIFFEKRQRIRERICNHLSRKEVFGYVFSLATTPIFMGILFGISYRYNFHAPEVPIIVPYIMAILIMTFFIIIW